jgi:hypothetical protein
MLAICGALSTPKPVYDRVVAERRQGRKQSHPVHFPWPPGSRLAFSDDPQFPAIDKLSFTST